MAEDTKSVAWIGAFAAIIAALIAAGATIWSSRKDPTLSSPPVHQRERPEHPNRGPVVMGQLEPGINRQGQDLTGDQGVPAANAPICAEMCRTRSDCESMTYVISLKTCWLKSGVPAPFPPGGFDYVSASKRH